LFCKYLPTLLLFAATTLVVADDAPVPECMLSYRFGPQQHMLVVEKSSHKLFVYSNYSSQPVETFSVTTGRVNGQKLEEGDLKTPEGIYFFDATLTGGQLPKSDDYGDKAFTLSYPNPYDRLHNRDGHGIWLHGANDPGKTVVPNNSRGCVVLNNRDLIRLSKYIFLRQTPICIYDRIQYETPDNLRRRRDQFLGQLRDWKAGWESQDIDRYIAYFHPAFRYMEMDLAGFRRYKEGLNRSYEFIRLFLDGISIYGYGPARVARFDQVYLSDKNQFHSGKIQYWLEDEGRLRILDESTQSLPPVQRVEASAGNFVSIEEFRRQTLRQVRGESHPAPALPVVPPVSLQPAPIHLKRIAVDPERVRIEVQADGIEPGLRLVPVLRLESDGRADFHTLAGIGLDNGIPQGYQAALALVNGSNRIEMTKERSADVRSLTLFIALVDGEVRQISTYIVGAGHRAGPAGKK
jgi:hypothetical protein